MITLVNFSPKYYSPGNNPIIWSVSSDKWDDNNVYDFKYVFDVYIDGAFINRFKQRPNPIGVGMLDVSTMIDPYLEIGDFANEVGSNVVKPFKTGYNAVCAISVKVGEEYRSPNPNSPLVIYNGIANTEGDPQYLLGAQGFEGGAGGTGAAPCHGLPWSLDWQEQQRHLQVQQINDYDYWGLFGYVAPYIMKSNTVYLPTTCGGPGLFLSDEPRTVAGGAWQTTTAAPPHNMTVNDLAYDRRTLSFLNRNPVYEELGGDYLQAASPKVAWFEFYNEAGANIGEMGFGNYGASGGAPRPTCGDPITTFSTSLSQELLSLRIGPKDLEEMDVWEDIGEVPAYYTVQLFNTLAIDSNCDYTPPPTVPLSELVTVNIVEDCYSNIYPRARVAFLNEKGGRDYFNFQAFAEKTVDASKQEWYQSEVDWGGTTPVQLTDNESGDTTQNWLRGGTRQYNKTVNTRWTITSDFLTQDQVDFLKAIVQSPQTWVYIADDDWPYTCKVSEGSYTVKTIKQVKLFTATFNLELSTQRTMQTI
jgi:hypothetical protein